MQINNLNYCFPKAATNTLKNITMSINKGEYLSIVGTSGSGKSTLLSILGLINQPSSGEYLILGRNTTNLTNKSISLIKNNEIGFIFQNFNLLNQFSVYDNVALPLSYNPAIKRNEYKEKVISALSLVNMSNFQDRMPGQLSGGQQQRIAIARALVNSPSIILADEPTGNLDSENSRQVFELIKKLNKTGITICLITHDINYAEQADTVFEMQDGELTAKKNTLSEV
ncbi:ABC transporter ATP-binding protein [Cognaticolwellia mytili]|uniref:ABC transporter ATP-binding protein n=1 Tax=Cognaticolwellia mytili TaxID=1888913 RepID=UPI001F1881FD|nr:ABC transporter ATP-binding protein [Cognaticolwellia mytili]